MNRALVLQAIYDQKIALILFVNNIVCNELMKSIYAHGNELERKCGFYCKNGKEAMGNKAI